LVAKAIILPMTGWLASVFGRKRLLMASVVGFTVSSFLCGLAPNLGSLIVFRILQGATGGALQPLSQAVLLEAFPPHERGKAMGFWGQGIVVAPILGPVLGGWLTDNYSWRWVFYINIPVGIASIVLTKLFIFDLPVFKARSFAVGVFLMTIVGFVMYGSMVLLPVMLQTLLGYPSVQAGIAMAPRGAGAFFMMQITGQLTGRVDPRKLLTTGLVVGGVTLLWLSNLNLQAGYWDVFWPQLIQGFGMSLLFVPLTTIAMDPVPRERMGNATSLFNLMRNLGGSIGIAITGTMLARQQQASTAMLGANVTLYDPASQSMLAGLRGAFMAAGAGAAAAPSLPPDERVGVVQGHAAMVAFVGIFQLMGIAFVVLVPLVLLMKRPRARAGPAAH